MLFRSDLAGVNLVAPCSLWRLATAQRNSSTSAEYHVPTMAGLHSSAGGTLDVDAAAMAFPFAFVGAMGARKVEGEEAGVRGSPSIFGSRGARVQMSAVTAIRPLREYFISSGSYCDATWRSHAYARYRRGERGARGAAVALHVSWAGRTLWAHDASHAPVRR